MLYKTIILELLQQRPQMHDQLRKERMLLATVERLARDLKTLHEAWKERLARAKPGNPNQSASEALEMALVELQDRLSPESPQSEDPLSLDAAIAHLHHPTPAE